MRLKNIFLFGFFSMFLLLNAASYAQSQGYVKHTLKTGETLSALATQYHTTVGDIMRLNGMHQDAQLKFGDEIKIPSVKSAAPSPSAPVAQKPSAAVVQAPVSSAAKTHTVQQGESLYRVSKLYNVPLDKLQQWNNLPDYNVKIGQVLVVSESTAPATTSVEPMPSAQTSTTDKTAETSIPAQTEPIEKTTPAPIPPAQKEEAAAQTKELAEDKNDTVTKAETQPEQTATTTEQTAPVNNTPPEKTSTTDVSNIPAEGYFTTAFGVDAEGRSMQTKNGTAMTFKTASGWSDKKYYILMNDVPPGSIVKITSPSNKIIYAKVLWSLGDMKENEGLNFRISNAAASVLGINDATFNLTVTYYE